MSRAVLLALVALSPVMGGCRVAAEIENHIAFFPHPYPIGDWTPDPRVQDVYIDTPDGERLHGWLAEPDDGRPRGQLSSSTTATAATSPRAGTCWSCTAIG